MTLVQEKKFMVTLKPIKYKSYIIDATCETKAVDKAKSKWISDVCQDPQVSAIDEVNE